MKDMKQIQLILKHLNDAKAKHLVELARLNTLIEKKKSSYLRMQDYRNDYLNQDNLRLTRVTPGLNQNIHLFVEKINTVMKQSEIEIDTLQSSKILLLSKINEVDKQIDVMTIFENNLKTDFQTKQDKNDQAVMDDIVATLSMRRDNE